ncbi:putative 28S ribosomal protein S6, mitochondrial [Cryptotermes secundus]|uniref:Small ribosomal subunit protein bS6m n=1 Tax=Cryptotermes secundus TaxID=105785 RepID=A0A2J7R9D5_9NEOP|nr:putative 28S ribosomal protein S6, mitochondrial [Cryptotermes secundus]
MNFRERGSGDVNLSHPAQDMIQWKGFPDLLSTLRRSADAIFNKGGIIRKVENLGTRNLPYKMSAHDAVHKKGSYFVFQFICPPASLHDLEEEYGRDVDIIRRRIFKVEAPEEFECTLHEEILPPAYRYMPALGNDFIIVFFRYTA